MVSGALNTHWHMESIYDSIAASLEAHKNWTARGHQNKVEKEAYLRAFSKCQQLVQQRNFNPRAALLTLDRYHDEVLAQQLPPFFSLGRWLYDVRGAEEQAIRVAFQVVDAVTKRFLC